MSDLLQQLSSFLNLSKLVAITVPGMLATLALLFFLNPPACSVDPGNCWYCQGQQKPADAEAKAAAAAKSKATPPTRAQGTYLVSKLTWGQADQAYKNVLATEPKAKLDSCARLPEYIISQSRLTSDKEKDKILSDLEPANPKFLLQDMEGCNSGLIAAQAELNKRDASQQNLIAVANASLTTLATALTTAKSSVNKDLEASLTVKVAEASRRLEHENQVDAELKAAANSIPALQIQITNLRNNIADVSTAVQVDAPPAKTTWQTVATTLANNVMLFLLVSMLVGQLLDPIQRAITSIDPIRGFTFPILNRLYSTADAIGGIRFGDQRYMTTRSLDVDSLLRREPHVLEPSYAIGMGLLTQAEYGSLQDQFYSQSQVATGLMLPLGLLAAVGYFRLRCCQMVEYKLAFFVCMGVTVFLLLAGIGIFAWSLRHKDDAESVKKREKDREKRLGDEQREDQLRRIEQQRQETLQELAEKRRLLASKQMEEQYHRLADARARARYEADPGPEPFRSEFKNGESLKREIADLEEAIKNLEYQDRRTGYTADTKARKEKLKGLKQSIEDLRSEQQDSGLRNWMPVVVLVFGPLFGMGFLISLGLYYYYYWLDSWWLVDLAIGLPVLQVICFAAGIDRLHLFYSELQARICGAAKKQEDSQIQKFADILTDPDPKKSFLAELQTRQTEISELLKNLKGSGTP